MLSKSFEIIEKIGVDGIIIDEINDADLETDFGIQVRLHWVKILKEIHKLKSFTQIHQTDNATQTDI